MQFEARSENSRNRNWEKLRGNGAWAARLSKMNACSGLYNNNIFFLGIFVVVSRLLRTINIRCWAIRFLPFSLDSSHSLSIAKWLISRDAILGTMFASESVCFISSVCVCYFARFRI